MSEEELGFDPRTRRARKSVKAYDNVIKEKDTAELDRQKAQFQKLIKMPEYQTLKTLAYALCLYRAQPSSLDEAIAWHYSAVRRSGMDILFNQVEELGKDIPVEDKKVGKDKTRPSFFADSLEPL